MPSFNHEGLRLHYEVHGTGRPVVMLHGITVTFFGNYGAFGWIQRLNAKGLQVIGLDFRGHGKSDKPTDPADYGTGKLAGDVLALLDDLRLEEASLVGYSLGSMIALHLLHAAPKRWKRGVLIATGDGLVGVPPYTHENVGPKLQEALRRETFPVDLPSHVSTYWVFATKVGGDRLAALAAASATYPPPAASDLARIEAPVLVVSGEKDVVLGTGVHLAASIPGARYLEIPDADHFSLSQDAVPQAAVADFLAAQ